MKQLKCSDEIHQAIKTQSAQRRITMEDLVEDALREWLTPTGARADCGELGSKLYRILTSGDHDAIRAVTHNIDLAYDRLRPQVRMNSMEVTVNRQR